MPVKIVAIITPKPGSEAVVEAALRTIVARTRADEPGNLRYDLWRDPGEAGHFIVDELYADAAAIEAHRQSDYYAAFRKALTDHLASAPSVFVVDAVDVADAI